QFYRVNPVKQVFHGLDHVAAIRSRLNENLQVVSFGVSPQDSLLHDVRRRHRPASTLPLGERVNLPVSCQPVEELLHRRAWRVTVGNSSLRLSFGRMAHTRTQEGGTTSRSSTRRSFIQRRGASTSLSHDGFSQAPHQLKLLLAMMWCRQALMSRRSSCSGRAGTVLTRVVGCPNRRFAETHGGSSENKNKCGWASRSAIRVTQRR